MDLNNPPMVGPFDPAADWKRAMIVHLGNMFQLHTLVETGTCWGDTVAAVCGSFADVWSIELSSYFHESAKNRFANTPNVHLFLGSSGEILPSVISQTSGPLLFWLDAHAAGGQPGDGDQTAAEIDTILRMRPDSLVLIDDTKPGIPGVYHAPDALISAPNGWKSRFMHGMLVLHAGGYDIPEVF